MKALDWRGRLEVAPYQDEDALHRAGLTPAQGRDAVWLILPDGQRYRGAGAAWATLAELIPILGAVGLALYHLPGSRQLQDAAYRWVAANRGRLAKYLPPLDDDAECSSDPK